MKHRVRLAAPAPPTDPDRFIPTLALLLVFTIEAEQVSAQLVSRPVYINTTVLD